MDKSGINVLKDILSRLLELPVGFNEWERLYSIALEKLRNRIDSPGIESAEAMADLTGLTALPGDTECYVIHKVPEDTVKYTWGHIKESWDDIWCPPGDDALLICFENYKLILLTHWGEIYYSG